MNGDTTGSAITFVSSGGYESTASFLSGSSQGIELSTTDTIVVMTVTSLDETVKSTYTFYVDVKESPFLSSLDVIGEQMVPAFTASSYTYAVNVLATVSSITLSSIVSSDVPHVSLTVAAPDGTKSITSESSLTTPVALDYGVNALLVTVSGAEGTTVYSISITRADASSVTALEIGNYKWESDPTTSDGSPSESPSFTDPTAFSVSYTHLTLPTKA